MPGILRGECPGSARGPDPRQRLDRPSSGRKGAESPGQPRWLPFAGWRAGGMVHKEGPRMGLMVEQTLRTKNSEPEEVALEMMTKETQRGKVIIIVLHKK